jgi:hypothetical protein
VEDAHDGCEKRDPFKKFVPLPKCEVLNVFLHVQPLTLSENAKVIARGGCWVGISPAEIRM